MAKTLVTSGDYTIKTGTGSGGSNTINLDSSVTRVLGNLVVDGSQTIVDSATLQVDDPIVLLSRNNSGTDVDSGIMINRSGIANNAALYWNEGDDVFKAVTTTSDGSGTSITDTALANVRVAEPSNSSDAATKNYVDTQISGGGYSLFFNGDDSSSITASPGTTVYFSGGNNITTSATEEPDQLNINLNRDLNGIDTISTDRSNQNLTLTANGAGSIVIDNVLTFSGPESTPAIDSSIPKLYHKTAAGGGTGVFFVNSDVSATEEGELISKKKATALAIALG
jgi:hypothetical protein